MKYKLMVFILSIVSFGAFSDGTGGIGGTNSKLYDVDKKDVNSSVSFGGGASLSSDLPVEILNTVSQGGEV